MTSTVACLLFLIAHDPDAVIVGVDPFLNSRADQLVALAARFAIPAIHTFRELAIAGGLTSYGTNASSGYRRGR
jgi:putative ABC transport system substrate-binding protein